MSPNPSGTNGGTFIPETPYGAVKQQTELLQAAPISGAPISGSALNTPRRSGQQAKRTRQRASQQPQPVEAPPPLAPPPYEVQVAQAWADIARTPGAGRFPILGALAQQAEMEAQRVQGVPVPQR